MELATGNILSHRYQIIRQLGKGGFGQTFLACDRQLPNQNRCVIKQFKPQCQDAETVAIARRLFETEAKILQELGIHRHIPCLFDPSVSNKKFSFTILRKAFSACKHAGAHLRNPVYIGYNPDACSFRAHSTERQFTFHRTRRTKSQSRICHIREIAEHK